MGTSIDHVGRVNLGAAPDRRPSLNTQAAIAEYDYRFAAWEVIDGDDLKAVCKRLDVPGGPTVLGPKVAALRARLEACAKVGRPPPERPTQPPTVAVKHLSVDEAVALALGPTDKARVGIAFDATGNASAKEMKGRALVTRVIEPSAEAAPAPLDDAPWRQALKLKVTAAAVKAVAEQEGRDPVKELRAAGFTQEAERLLAEIKAAVLPLELKPVNTPERPHIKLTPGNTLELEWQHTGPRWFGVAGSVFGPAAEFTVIADGPPSAVEQVVSLRPAHLRAYVAIAGNGEDVPTPAELAAEAETAEALWDLTHSAETVLAAQAEHARQRELLQQLGEEERVEARAPVQPTPPAVAEPARPAPKVPVARGRSQRTLAASAETPVVKKPSKARDSAAASSPAPSASATSKGKGRPTGQATPPPQATAAPVKPIPLPTWPAKVKAEPSDPPPKRDRSRHRKVAPKPPEPERPILLGMSPETTTPTTVRRPHRRKVPAPAPVVATPKVKVSRDKPVQSTPGIRKARKAAAELARLDALQNFVGPEALRVQVERALDALLCRKVSLNVIVTPSLGTYDGKPETPPKTVRSRRWRGRVTEADTVLDLSERRRLMSLNRFALLTCPPRRNSDPVAWKKNIHRLANGEIAYDAFAQLCGVADTSLGKYLMQHGVRRDLLPCGETRRGMRKGQQERSRDRTSDLGIWFGTAVSGLRNKYALRQPDLARALDVPVYTVTKVEQGRFLPCPELIMRAAKYFEVDWYELLPAKNDEERLRRLVDDMRAWQLTSAVAAILRELVLPCLGVKPPPYTTPQQRVTDEVKS